MLDRTAQLATRYVRTPRPRAFSASRRARSRNIAATAMVRPSVSSAGASSMPSAISKLGLIRLHAAQRRILAISRPVPPATPIAKATLAMSSRRLITPSERSKLDPFVVATGDASPRDQRDLMERPFFSLAKAKRTTPILYEAGDIRVEVFAVPEHGMATIWDADVLIWAASQIVEAENLGLKTSRFLRFTPYQLLAAVGRQTGARDYKLLKGALTRLQATVIRTSIRQGEHWRRHQFSWINEWEECATRDGRVQGMEFVFPDWFYRGVIDRSLVLTIDPAYFSLTGGSSAGSTASRVSMPAASREDGCSRSHTSMRSRAAWCVSLISRCRSGVSRRVSRFPATGCESSARRAAAYSAGQFVHCPCGQCCGSTRDFARKRYRDSARSPIGTSHA